LGARIKKQRGEPTKEGKRNITNKVVPRNFIFTGSPLLLEGFFSRFYGVQRDRDAECHMPMKRRQSLWPNLDAENEERMRIKMHWPCGPQDEEPDPRDERHTCLLCREGVTLKSLPLHVQRKHGEAIHTCPVAHCGYNSESAKDWLKHMSEMHPFPHVRCDKCPDLLFESQFGVWVHRCPMLSLVADCEFYSVFLAVASCLPWDTARGGFSVASGHSMTGASPW